MASSHLIRLGRIKGDNGVLVALKHNKRTLQNERGASVNIDATKSSLNYSLHGDDSPESISRHVKAQMAYAGIDKARKNGVMAVEVIFSLPIDRHKQDTRAFFTDCYEWVKQTFAGELLSFDVHLDESAPHAHAVILPLIEGKMRGSEMIGGTGNLMRFISNFHAEVGKRYGLSKVDTRRLSALDKQTLEKLVLTRLKGDHAMKSAIWPQVRDAIHDDPMPYARQLGIDMPKRTRKVNKTFTQIMTSKGKGKSIETTNPI